MLFGIPAFFGREVCIMKTEIKTLLMYFTASPPPFTHIVSQSGGKDECAEWFYK